MEGVAGSSAGGEPTGVLGDVPERRMKGKEVCNSPFLGSRTLPLLINLTRRCFGVGVRGGSGDGDEEGDRDVDALGLEGAVVAVVVVGGGEDDGKRRESMGEDRGRGTVGDGGDEWEGCLEEEGEGERRMVGGEGDRGEEDKPSGADTTEGERCRGT